MGTEHYEKREECRFFLYDVLLAPRSKVMEGVWNNVECNKGIILLQEESNKPAAQKHSKLVCAHGKG